MKSLDTNVIIRALTQDDAAQARTAARILSSRAIGVAKSVLVETEWVLRSAYGFEAREINEALRRLIGLPNLEVEDRVAVVRALDWHSSGMDFADAIHLASSGRAAEFAKTATALRAVPPVRAY